MFKKSVISLSIAAALVFAVAPAAMADYASEVEVVAGSASIVPGGSTPITASGLTGTEAEFEVASGPSGSTLTSIVFAAAKPTVVKPIVGGTATATFTASTVGTYVITVTDATGTPIPVTITVATGAAGGGLPSTGGTIPAEALWLGVGAIGLGAIAVTVAMARRKAVAQR